MPKQAITDTEIINCFDVISELRTHLIKDKFLSTIRHMESEGYKLAFIKDEENVVTVAGYRVSTNLFMGKNLYIDDLITSKKSRSLGYGAKMVRWLREKARQDNCNFYHLDSGTHRGEAHKFYFKQGFTIASYHFGESIENT